MGEIKFRGKRKDNGEWVNGYGVIVGEHYGRIYGEEREASIFVEYDKVSRLNFQLVDVDPETVGQYTGLKDRNGKDIFEGDILDGSYINPMSKEMIKRHYEVVFDKANFHAQLIGHHPYGTTMLYFENKNSEVIGNRWDNPSLWEVTNE